jgi:glutamate-ammonia-ligase adenylyltransferase
LTRARLVLGDRGLGRRLRRLLRRLVYGAPLPAAGVKEIMDVRARMETELGKETPGRRHVKFGRGGLVDVEFLVQTLQLRHGATHPAARVPATVAALAELARAGVLEADTAELLVSHYRVLRRVSAALRLLSVRPSDTIDLAGPVPARVASALGYASRETFLEEYRRCTTAVRTLYAEVMA